MGKLDGKVAIVTGAASGIGKEVARLFAAEGAKVACAARTLGEGKPVLEGSIIPSVSEVRVSQIYERSLYATVSEIQEAGGTAIGVQTDVSDEESCDYLVYTTRRLLGPVDVLVNDAVLSYFIPIREYPIKWWRDCFAVNVHGPFMLSQKVLPQMIERHGGAIVNISSGAAIGPGRGPYMVSTTVIGGGTMYGATKAAIERFTQGLAEEVYRYGVSVTCVAPSNFVATPGAVYHKVTAGLENPQYEPPDMMARAILLLATEPLDRVTGRVTYSQVILKEFGWITDGKGIGIDRPGSGYSQQ